MDANFLILSINNLLNAAASVMMFSHHNEKKYIRKHDI